MFKNIYHVFASIFKGALRIAGLVERDATTPIPLFGNLSPLQVGESIAAAINPESVDVINAGMALLGQVAGAVHQAKTAGQAVVAAKGLSLNLDEALLNIVLPVVNKVIDYIENPTAKTAATPALPSAAPAAKASA